MRIEEHLRIEEHFLALLMDLGWGDVNTLENCITNKTDPLFCILGFDHNALS